MPAIRETIFAAIDAAMKIDVAEYERMPSGDPAKFPARHVHDGGQAVIEREAQTSRYAMEITIEGFVQGDGGAVTHAGLNALYADTVTRMMGLIGAVAEIEAIDEGDFRPGVAPLASRRSMSFAQDFTVTFATRRGDPNTI